MPKLESPKSESVALIGISLTAAALIIASMSFLLAANSTIGEENVLFQNAIRHLQSVALIFLYSSIFSLASFGLCYLYDFSEGKFKAEIISAVLLVIFIGLSLSLILWGVFQLITVLQIIWG